MEANGQSNNRTLQIKELVIFNPKFGNDSDNEIGKILYCYPIEVSEDNQLKEIGLCEAIVKFSQTFNSDTPCEALHTLKARHIFYQAEPGYWFIMVLSIPSVLKTTTEGNECVEYLDDEVQNNVFQSVLLRLYEKFALLNGKLQSVVEELGVEELKIRLRKYYDLCVQRIDADQCGISYTFRGLQFLPLQRDSFLRIQCFINNFMITWPQIKYMVLLQREKLIWSGVDKNHIQLVYDYLVNDLLSQHFITGADKQSTFGVILKRESHVTLEEESTGSASTSTEGRDSQNSRRPSGDSFMTASSQTLNGHGSISRRLHILIYKAEQSYLTILIPDSIPFDRQLITKIEAFLNLNFTPIARDLSKVHRNIANSTAGDAPTNEGYIYYNNLNFAVKMCPGYQCDLEAYKLLVDLKLDLSKMNENGEIITKMVLDNWMVAKVSNQREFYAIFNHKNSNLLEIDEEMRKLTEAHLTNIFFQE